MNIFPDQVWYIPKDLLLARIDGYLGQADQARTHFTAARALLEENVREHPYDARLHSSLGIAYAGLGRKDDAIREGKKGVELLPLSKDAMIAPFRMEALAEVYAMVGEHDAAIEILAQLVSIPSTFSVPLIRLDPSWGGLRDNPLFQKLIAEK